MFPFSDHFYCMYTEALWESLEHTEFVSLSLFLMLSTALLTMKIHRGLHCQGIVVFLFFKTCKHPIIRKPIWGSRFLSDYFHWPPPPLEKQLDPLKGVQLLCKGIHTSIYKDTCRYLNVIFSGWWVWTPAISGCVHEICPMQTAHV